MAELSIYQSQERLPGTAGGVPIPANLGTLPLREGQALAQESRQFAKEVAAGEERNRQSRIALEAIEKTNTYRSALGEERRKRLQVEGMDVLRFEDDDNGNPLSVTESYGRVAGKLQDGIEYGKDWTENEKRGLRLKLEGIYQQSVDEMATHEFDQKRLAGISQLKVTKDELIKAAADRAEVAPGYYPEEEINQAADTINFLKENGFLTSADAEQYMEDMDRGIIQGSLNRMLLNNPEAVKLLMTTSAGKRWQEGLSGDEITKYTKNSDKLIKAQEAADKKAEEEAEKERLFQQDRSITLDILNGDLVTARHKLLTSGLSGEKLRTLNDAIDKAEKGEEEKSDPEVYSSISRRVYVDQNITPADVYNTAGLSVKDKEHFVNELQTRENKKDKESIVITRGRILSQLDRDRNDGVFTGEKDDENNDQWARAVAGFNEYVNSNPDAKPKDLVDFYNEMMKPYVVEKKWWFDTEERNVEKRIQDMQQHGWFGQRRNNAPDITDATVSGGNVTLPDGSSYKLNSDGTVTINGTRYQITE